jgi:hypothetical protein
MHQRHQENQEGWNAIDFFSAEKTTDLIFYIVYAAIRSREPRRLKLDIWLCNYIVDLCEVLEYGDPQDWISK